MVLVWYPTGVAKLVDDAKVTAIRKGVASTLSMFAVETPIGVSSTAAAALLMNSVSRSAIKYRTASTTSGPMSLTHPIVFWTRNSAAPVSLIATPKGRRPASKMMMRQSMASYTSSASRHLAKVMATAPASAVTLIGAQPTAATPITSAI